MQLNPESTRRGRVVQGIGIFFILLAMCLSVLNRLEDGPWWVLALNAFTCGMGGFIIAGPGAGMVRSAKRHRAYMEQHRQWMAIIRDYEGDDLS